MATYVLVHPLWHGGWCWEKVVPLIEAQGHNAVAPDLPGHGGDTTPFDELSMDAYVARITDVLDAQSEPVVLVGHSMTGVVISQVAERRPDKVRVLVYLTAFLLQDGQSRLDVGKGQPSAVGDNLVVNKEEGSCVIRQDALKLALYADCLDEDVARASARLVREPFPGLMTFKQHVTDEGFGRVRRVYIECLQDRAIVPAVQKEMYDALPCERVISMDTSHSPFLSAPKELAAHLVSLA